MSAGPTMPVEVEVVLDLHELLDGPTTPEGLAELWTAVEQDLIGRDLRGRRLHELNGSTGTVRLDVVRIAESVDLIRPTTRFGIVGVREAARVRHRCRPCSSGGVTRYGPFVCQACGSGRRPPDNHVCDAHVSILDGALTATCAEHRPGCTGCGLPAAFRCAGPSCRTRGTPWCGAHRRPHPDDPDIDYCPDCFALLFPACAVPGCADIGTVECEHVEADGRACGRRTCTRHGSRWQVFGGERLGLGRCGAHQELHGLGPTEVLRQIVGGAGRRRVERPPTLRGFAYNLRTCGHGRAALDYDRIVEDLGKVGARMQDDRAVAAALDRAWPRWRRERDRIAADQRTGQDLVARLRRLVPQHDPRYGPEIAASLGFADYVPPVAQAGRSRRALLWVTLPQHLHGRLKGKGGGLIRTYGDHLGADVRIDESGAGR
jgi:hypothetical protein